MAVPVSARTRRTAGAGETIRPARQASRYGCGATEPRLIHHRPGSVGQLMPKCRWDGVPLALPDRSVRPSSWPARTITPRADRGVDCRRVQSRSTEHVDTDHGDRDATSRGPGIRPWLPLVDACDLVDPAVDRRHESATGFHEDVSRRVVVMHAPVMRSAPHDREAVPGWRGPAIPGSHRRGLARWPRPSRGLGAAGRDRRRRTSATRWFVERGGSREDTRSPRSPSSAPRRAEQRRFVAPRLTDARSR